MNKYFYNEELIRLDEKMKHVLSSEEYKKFVKLWKEDIDEIHNTWGGTNPKRTQNYLEELGEIKQAKNFIAAITNDDTYKNSLKEHYGDKYFESKDGDRDMILTEGGLMCV